MRVLALFIALTAFSFQGIAQNLLAQAKSGDNWGYIDSKGEFVIDAQYRNCHAFSESLAPIYDKKAKTFYFIKPDGSKLETEVDKFKLKNIFGFGTVGFSEGIVPVQIGKKWGYMNNSGKLIAEAKYDKASMFRDGLGIVKSGSDFYIINESGTATKIEINGLEDVKQFSNGVAPFKANGLSGFLNKDGSISCKAQFKAIGYLGPDDMAWAKNDAGMVGFVSKSGDTKVDFQYASAKNFTDGVARVKKDDSWIYINSVGKEVKPANADSYGKFSDGLAYAKKDGKVGFIGKDGQWVIEPKFDKVRNFSNGLAAVRIGEKWGYIAPNGKYAIEPQFEAVKDFSAVSK